MNKVETLQGETPWEVVFNYMGQMESRLEGKLSPAREFGGKGMSETLRIGEKLIVNGWVIGGELELYWGYSELHYDHGTIERLAEAYVGELQGLIDHCTSLGKEELTPSDYGLGSAISYKELDAFLKKAAGQTTIMEF